MEMASVTSLAGLRLRRGARLLALGVALAGSVMGADGGTMPKWSVREIALEASRTYGNAYVEAEVIARLRGPKGERLAVPGYWDGGRRFAVRFTCTAAGTWSYVTESADAGLGGKSGRVVCGAPRPGSHGFLRRDPANPYGFVHDDGTRSFVLGNTFYELVGNAAAGDRWKEAVDKTVRHGMNKIRFSIARMTEVQDRRNPYRSSRAFVDDNQDQLNPEHWRVVDRVVEHLGEKGVTADLIVFQRGLVDVATDEQNRRYLRYVMSRYAAYPHVWFCLVNEWNYTKKPLPFWDEMGRLAKQQDPWHRRGEAIRGLSVHQQTRFDFMMYESSADWLSHAIVQLGVRNRGKVMRGGDEWNLAGRDRSKVMPHGDDWGHFSIAYNWGRRMPVINDEYGYIGEPADETEPKGADGKSQPYSREKHRRTLWAIYAAGGYASAGDKTMYDDGAPYVSANWHDTPEWGDVLRLAYFYTTKGIPYWRMAGDAGVVRAGERVYAASEPGREYVVYAAAGGKVTLGLPKGAYRAWRFDPRTGEEVELGAAGGGEVTWTMPDGRDWVVRVRRGG